MITVIGLGVEQGDLTKRGEDIILAAAKSGRKIVVRTANTKSYQTVVALGVPHICLDYVYENSRSFATLSKNLAKAVAEQGEYAGAAAQVEHARLASDADEGRKHHRILSQFEELIVLQQLQSVRQIFLRLHCATSYYFTLFIIASSVEKVNFTKRIPFEAELF